MARIGVLVSGGGSNLQSIIDAISDGRLQAEVGVVISSKAGVYALERAEIHGIASRVIDPRRFESRATFTQSVVDCLAEFGIEYVCFAGYLRILDPLLTETYPNRAMNIHPALLPAFGGKGMYGHHVHEAVLASGAKFSGATVHFVTPETDVGPIIIQDTVPIEDHDIPDTLAAKVLQVEHRIYPEAVKLVIEDRLVIDGMRTRIKR